MSTNYNDLKNVNGLGRLFSTSNANSVPNMNQVKCKCNKLTPSTLLSNICILNFREIIFTQINYIPRWSDVHVTLKCMLSSVFTLLVVCSIKHALHSLCKYYCEIVFNNTPDIVFCYSKIKQLLWPAKQYCTKGYLTNRLLYTLFRMSSTWRLVFRAFRIY